MIDANTLTNEDIGRPITYKPKHGGKYYGHLSSFRDGKIWVKFRGPTGECTPSEDCYWGWKEGESDAKK